MSLDAVFKAYDVRGRTDSGELNPELFRRIGGAFVRLTGAEAVAVGRDCRASSASLFRGLVEGITGANADVIDLGAVPTDLVYFFSGSRRVPGAIITASHNPPEYNGLKLCRAGAAPVGADSGLEIIKADVASGQADGSGPTGQVRVESDPITPYVDHLLEIVDVDSVGSIQVAADGGNGMAGVTLPAVFSRLNADLDGLYLEPDGSFPNHPADPIQPENLLDLIGLVKAGGHHLGVAFDGDADRAFFVDEKAGPLSGSTVTALIARWLLKNNPGTGIVHNLIISRAVPEVVTESGGTPIRTKVGHSFIKQVMADTDAIFGGEHSGHYYFRDNFRADSGMLALLILMRVLSEDERPLSELRVDVERYAASGELNYQVDDPAASIEAIASAFDKADQDRLDGLSVDVGEAWFNVRPSNTEPLLRLNVEAAKAEEVSHVVKQIESILEE